MKSKTTLEKLEDQQRKTILIAVEFGYKACEKGESLQSAIQRALEIERSIS